MVHIPITVIAPLAIGGILLFAVLTAMPSNNRAFAQGSYLPIPPPHAGHSNMTGNAQESNSTGNAQESNSTGNGTH